MKIFKVHHEGYKILLIILALLIAINFSILYFFCTTPGNKGILIIISILLYIFFLRFFRKPTRQFVPDSKSVFAPADGKVVVIEETIEPEFFNDKRLQVSIFMSVWNVHINWYPVKGLIKYFKYHPGKYLVARHPKSSTENERSTVVITTPEGKEILVRQIAGIVARKISTYCKTGQTVEQGEEMGFIKFGSRVDIFLPIGSKVNVKLHQVVKGKKSVIAKIL